MTMRHELDVALRVVYPTQRLADPLLSSTKQEETRQLLRALAEEVMRRESCTVCIDESGYTPRSATLQIVFSPRPADDNPRRNQYSLLLSVSYLVTFFFCTWNVFDAADPRTARIVDAPGDVRSAVAEEIAAALRAEGYRELSYEECREAIAWLDPSDTPVDAPVVVFDAAFSND